MRKGKERMGEDGVLTRAFGMGALWVSTSICLMSTVIHSGQVNHSHHSQ